MRTSNLVGDITSVTITIPLQAASGCTIDFWFEKVNLACSAADRSCHDYVEVRYADKLAIRGPRYGISLLFAIVQ